VKTGDGDFPLSFCAQQYFNKQKIRDSLEQEVTSDVFAQLFQMLRDRSNCFAYFSNPMEFIKFMHSQESTEGIAKDELLKEVFLHVQGAPHHLWDCFLSLIFWPMLDNLFHRKSFWEPSNDLENFWHNLYQAFLEAIRGILAKSITNNLAFQVKLGTFSRLHDIYEKEWEWDKLKTTCINAVEELPSIVLPDTAPSLNIIKNSMHKQYQTCLHQGIITESEFMILVGTNIYGKEIKDFVNETNSSYESLKKRRQRAQNKVQKFFAEK